jgi:cation diffusion facilitator CzcD-associated flavoprotein CzcO
LEKKLAAGFAGLWRKTSSQARFTSSSESFMRSKISNKQLLDDLLPEFEAGCRRFTPGSHYLDALQQPNTEYLKDAVSELTEEGIVTTSGKKVFCEIIVYATGFEPYQPRFPVIGRNGHNLSEDWSSEGPCESYMAAMVACYPNFFGNISTTSLGLSQVINCWNSLQPTYLSC